MPPLPRPGGNTLDVQALGNPIKHKPLGPEHLHPLDCGPFSFIATERLPTLTSAFSGPFPHSSAAELQHNI